VSLGLAYLITGTDSVTSRRLVTEGRAIPRLNGWNRIVHRDLKTGNLFLTWKDPLKHDKSRYPTVAIGDFGCSASDDDIKAGLAKAEYHSGITKAFAPPESPKYCQRGDIYMLGVTIHCLAVMSNMPNQDIVFRDAHPLNGLSNNELLKAVVRGCLARNPDTRTDQRLLPMLVFKAYTDWMKKRKDSGKKLPEWAFG
jgi:serine/threonine protein kinase